MILKRLIILLILLIPVQLWSKQDYYFQDVTQDYNLSNIGFTTICEDENGFVWSGGFNGLYYHNTISIEKVKLFNKTATTTTPIKIYRLYKDLNKNIWICTQNGLVKYLKEKTTFEYKKLQFPNINDTTDYSIENIVQLNDKEYLLHKDHSIFIYNELTNKVHQYNNDFVSNAIYLTKDSYGNIYIGTKDGKVYELQASLDQKKLLYQSPNAISSICKDGNNYYLGYKTKGVVVINSKGVIIDKLNSKSQGNKHINNNYIRKIIRRQNGEIWMGTNEGIYVLNNDELTLLDSKFETGLPHRWIYEMHHGLDDKIWVSTYAGGLVCYSEYNYKFKHILLDNSQKQMDKSHVATICEDSRGYIWIGSEDEGSIKVYSTTDKMFVEELPTEVLNNAIDMKTIVNISDEQIIFGKNASNIITLYNYKKGNIEKHIELPIKRHLGVRGAHYKNGILWVNNLYSIVAYDIKAQKVKNVYKCTSRIWQLYIDSSNNLWVCTAKGLYIRKPETDHLEQCVSNDEKNQINKLSIYSVCEDSKGAIWVGTTGQGLYTYHPEQKQLTPAPDYQLSAEDDIYNLIKDQHNNIWYITNKGLYRYDFTNINTDYYGTNSGTLNAENRLNASIISPSGKMYFGAKSGFTVVNPNTIKKNTNQPSVFLAELKVNNKPYKTDNNIILNTLSLSKLKTLQLKAVQNTLSFKVVSNNFIKPEKNSYKYRLINYDDNWVEIDQNKDIVFTKVPPGNYIFEAYGANNDHLWSKEPYRLEIRITPPLYSRWYALCSYGIILFIIGWLFYKELNAKIKLRKEITEERYKTAANELIHSERIKLFTNISHELRTPLSLIVSPISHILQKNIVNNEVKHMLTVADRNAKRLLKIADQSIDFRLLEIGKLKPNFGKQEIVQLIKDVSLCFEQQIIDRQIKFSFYSDFKQLNIVVDGDMIEKIVYNLFSNALKYTPEKQNISLNIYQRNVTDLDYDSSIFTGHRFTGQAVSISIKDTGPGIRKKFLPYVFERFSKGKEAHQTSTGIGLHLCKEYSKMNNGNMQLITENGNGATFILNLPVSENTHFEKSDLKQLVKFNFTDDITPQTFHNIDNSKAACILIVEDNTELKDFLKKSLESHFKIITAKEGEQAIKQMENITPDLIITDVSMPGMNGIELTKRLKQKDKYNNIPIIVMTAYADRSYQMESIVNGAEAFFTKPIDVPLLFAQINNSLQNRSRTVEKTDNPNLPLKEKSFIEKAEKIVEDNLQNPNFQVPDLLTKLNVSKTTLFRKLKAETQQNATSFIRDIRLKNAKKLLTNKQFNIDEIAAFVGFNYTSYFIKSFKEKYGITPSEYRKEVKQKDG